MRRKASTPVTDLEWRFLPLPCPVCSLSLEAANTGPASVEIRHIGTKISYEACRRQDRRREQRENGFEA